MKKILIGLFLTLSLNVALFGKDITLTIMNDNNFTIDTNKIDSIEYIPIGGVMIKYDSVEYLIYQMSEDTGNIILKRTDSKYIFKAMNKLIHPTKDQPEAYNKLRMALEIKPDASNVDILKAPENETAFIIHGQVNDAYFCHHALCNIVNYKGDNNGLISHMQSQEKSKPSSQTK